MKTYRRALRVHAYFAVLGALIHTTWHWFFPGYEVMKGLTDLQWDMINIFNWSTALFFLFLATLSFVILSFNNLDLSNLRKLMPCLVLFYLGRLIIEFILPAPIPLIVLKDTNIIIRLLLGTLILILLYPELNHKLRSNKQ